MIFNTRSNFYQYLSLYGVFSFDNIYFIYRRYFRCLQFLVY